MSDINVSIVRPAGLVGPNRQPGRFFAGKKQLEGGSAPVNLVHQEDVIGAILMILENRSWGKIYNLCAIEHPKRSEFYAQAAQSLNLEAPEFTNLPGFAFKTIDGTKITQDLGFVYQHPDPMAWV